MNQRVLGGIAIVMSTTIGCARLQCKLAEKGWFPRLIGHSVVTSSCDSGACLTGEVTPVEFGETSSHVSGAIHDGTIYDDSMMQGGDAFQGEILDGQVIDGDVMQGAMLGGLQNGMVYAGADASWNSNNYAYPSDSRVVVDRAPAPEDIGAGIPLEGKSNYEKAKYPAVKEPPKRAQTK